MGTPAPYWFFTFAVHREQFIKIGTPAKSLPKISSGLSKTFHTGSAFYWIALMQSLSTVTVDMVS